MDIERRAPAIPSDGRASYYDQPVLKPPDWGPQVIGYLWAGGIGAGSFITSSLAMLRGGNDDRAIAKLGYALSAAAMGASAPLLISHLGRPDRFHHMLRMWKPSSPMNAGVWGMTAMSGIAFSAAGLAAIEADAPLTALGLLGAPVALFVGTYTGVLLGHSSIPLWAKSSLLPALFGCSALATGAAAVAFFAEIFGTGSRKARKRVAAAERVASIAEGIALAAWLRETGEFAKPLREPPLKDVFEKGVVGAGIALPLSLPGSQRRSGPWDILKPLLVLAGGLALRYVLVEGGRRQSRDPEAYLKFTSTPPET